jgi:hypothetical protein
MRKHPLDAWEIELRGDDPPIEPSPYYGAIWIAAIVSCLGVWVLIGWSALV